jgi:opacity protein-like surface antigen
MLVKQTCALVLSIIFAASTAVAAPVCNQSAARNGIYVGGSYGGFSNYTLDIGDVNLSLTDNVIVHHRLIIRTIVSETLTTDQVPVGSAASAFVGYQFNEDWGVQLGYIWQQSQSMNFFGSVTKYDAQNNTTTINNDNIRIRLQAYNLYLAAKLGKRILGNFSAYVLIGPAWTHLTQKVTFVTNATESFKTTRSQWSPMVALGVSYTVLDALSVDLQYLFIMPGLFNQNSKQTSDDYKSSQVFTIGLKYTFWL